MHRSVINKLNVLILMLLIVYSGIGACACTMPAWNKVAGKEPSLAFIYVGTVGDAWVRGVLRYDTNSDEFVGEFYRSNTADLLKVAGRMSAPGAPIDLKVSEEGQGIVGHALLTSPDSGFWINGQNKKVPYGDDCSVLNGDLIPVNGGPAERVALHLNGQLNFTRSADALKNEDVAVAFRQALLDRNPRALAPLLDYPFHFYTQRGVPVVFASPQAVLKNFSAVAIFPHGVLLESVPHYLQTYKSNSDYDINGSEVVIEDGKVKRLCATGHPMYCPLVD